MMTAEERFEVMVKAKMCRACLSNEVIFTHDHMDACKPGQKTKGNEKTSFSCTFERCCIQLWICKSPAIKKVKHEFQKDGLGFAVPCDLQDRGRFWE